jgi:hypothetical protein
VSRVSVPENRYRKKAHYRERRGARRTAERTSVETCADFAARRGGVGVPASSLWTGVFAWRAGSGRSAAWIVTGTERTSAPSSFRSM